MKIVNKYAYTPALAREAMRAWWLWRRRAAMVVLPAMFCGFTAISLVLRQPLYFLPGLLAVFGLIVQWMQFSAGVRKEHENIKNNFHIDSPHMRIEVEGGEIRTTVGNTHNRARLADVTAVRETAHLLVLCLGQDATLGFKKDAFEAGDAAALREAVRAAQRQ